MLLSLTLKVEDEHVCVRVSAITLAVLQSYSYFFQIVFLVFRLLYFYVLIPLHHRQCEYVLRLYMFHRHILHFSFSLFLEVSFADYSMAFFISGYLLYADTCTVRCCISFIILYIIIYYIIGYQYMTSCYSFSISDFDLLGP